MAVTDTPSSGPCLQAKLSHVQACSGEWSAVLTKLRLTHSLWQVVAGAGAIDHEALVQLAGKAFGDLPNSSTSASDLVEQACLGPMTPSPSASLLVLDSSGDQLWSGAASTQELERSECQGTGMMPSNPQWMSHLLACSEQLSSLSWICSPASCHLRSRLFHRSSGTVMR